MKAGLASLDKAQRIGCVKALTMATVHLQRESMKVVPVDKGPLRRSAEIRKKGNIESPKKPTITLTFGYFGIEYAIMVHEELTRAHGRAYNIKYAKEIAEGPNPPWHTRGDEQKAKYLEDPFRNNINIMQKMIEISLRSVFKQ